MIRRHTAHQFTPFDLFILQRRLLHEKKVFSCLLRQGQDVNPVCVLTTGLELTDPFKANTITNTLTDAHGTLWPQVAALFPQTDVKCFLLFFVVPRLLPFGFIT